MRNVARSISALLLASLLMGCQTAATKAPQMLSGEDLLFTCPANLWRGMEAVGGALSISSQRLLFYPHHLNIQRKPEEVSLAEVVRVAPIEFGHIFKRRNGVLIKVRSGRTYRFVVDNRERVVNTINTALSRVRPLSNERGGVDAEWPVLFAFGRAWSGTTHRERSPT